MFLRGLTEFVLTVMLGLMSKNSPQKRAVFCLGEIHLCLSCVYSFLWYNNKKAVIL